MADLITTYEAAELMGVPEKEFTRLVRDLNLQAAQAGSKTQPRLWDRTVIEQLHHGPEGEEVRQTVQRKQQIEALFETPTFTETYANWKDALRPAADAMFNFNRFTKWNDCSFLRRRELYKLKEDLIARLYQFGYCHSLRLHTIDSEEEYCRACEGSKQDWRGESCSTCEGKGVIVKRGQKEYLAFCFRIEDKYYNWHVPKGAVDFEYELKDAPEQTYQHAEWSPRSGEKPIALEAEEDFLHAEALIRFVLQGFKQQERADKEEAKQKRREQMRQEGLARQAELRKAKEQADED